MYPALAHNRSLFSRPSWNLCPINPPHASDWHILKFFFTVGSQWTCKRIPQEWDRCLILVDPQSQTSVSYSFYEICVTNKMVPYAFLLQISKPSCCQSQDSCLLLTGEFCSASVVYSSMQIHSIYFYWGNQQSIRSLFQQFTKYHLIFKIN